MFRDDLLLRSAGVWCAAGGFGIGSMNGCCPDAWSCRPSCPSRNSTAACCCGPEAPEELTMAARFEYTNSALLDVNLKIPEKMGKKNINFCRPSKQQFTIIIRTTYNMFSIYRHNKLGWFEINFIICIVYIYYITIKAIDLTWAFVFFPLSYLYLSKSGY